MTPCSLAEEETRMDDAELAATHSLHHRTLIILPHLLCDQTRYDTDTLRHRFQAGNTTKWPPLELLHP